MSDPAPPRLHDIEAALRLFDETTSALSSRIHRLEEVLLLKQQELVAANTQLNQKLTELDRLTAWLNLVMSAVSSGVLAVDAQARITTCNAAARTALLGELEQPLGADYRRAFPGSPLLGVLAGSSTVAGYERIVRGPAGERRTLAATTSALRGQDGAIIGAVEVFEDVTEMRRLRESVERADRLKQLGEMAAGVAHEIRNPLNGIEGFASLLTRDLETSDRRHRYAAAIVEGVRALNKTLTALLAFTSPKTPQRRQTNPAQLARTCLDLMQAELDLHRSSDSLDENERGKPTPAIALELCDHWGSEEIGLDPSQLHQVLLNLIQNAVQAVQEAGTNQPRVRLTLSAHPEVKGLVVEVEDNGSGVPEKERQRIFTPFYTTKDRGTGLGLAIVHGIVVLHGGTLAVDDSVLGGARFRMIIPA